MSFYQEPILFSGTLRANLDALGKFPDDEIWKALCQAQLSEYLSLNMPLGLDHVINSEDEVWWVWWWVMMKDKDDSCTDDDWMHYDWIMR